MGSLLLKFVVGGIAGLVAWMLCTPFVPHSYAEYVTSGWEATFVLVVGALVGMAVGGLDGINRGGTVHAMRGIFAGLFFGAVGMTVGHGLSGVIVTALFGSDVFKTSSMMVSIMARALAFSGMGICLGAAIGAASLNVAKIIQGMIGGLLGSIVAGLLFDPISAMIGQVSISAGSGDETGGPGRLILAILLGAAIALFIGIVDRIARSAWLRLQLGRNEGREWSIDSPQTFIGSREGVHVPLFGDPNIAPVHASIQKQAGQYILTDGGSPMGTYVNGQRIGQMVLFNGAMIQIGGYALQFLMKHGGAPARGPEAYIGQSYPLGGMPGQPGPQPQAPAQPAAAWQPMATPIPQQPTTVITPTMVQPASTAALVALDGPLSGQRFPIGQSVDLGRECPAIPMSFDTAASRRHANVAPGPNGLAIGDLGSTNGTFVNGQRVSQAFAKAGDLVKIGSTTFRVEAT